MGLLELVTGCTTDMVFILLTREGTGTGTMIVFEFVELFADPGIGVSVLLLHLLEEWKINLYVLSQMVKDLRETYLY